MSWHASCFYPLEPHRDHPCQEEGTETEDKALCGSGETSLKGIKPQETDTAFSPTDCPIRTETAGLTPHPASSTVSAKSFLTGSTRLIAAETATLTAQKENSHVDQ